MPFSDHGLEMGTGDKTVPLSSSLGIRSDNTIITNNSHGDLPGKTANDVYELLAGDEPDHEIDFIKISKLLSFFVFSPIDLQIISPDGKKAGKNFSTGETINEIEEAYYTGYETDMEFLTIPNPMDGEYRVLTQGTGDGDYRIEVSNISENEEGEAGESTAEINGTAQAGQTNESIIEVQGDEVIAGEKDDIPPTIEIISPEEKEYLNNQILSIKYAAEDDITPPDKIISETYYDGNKFTASEIDLSLENLGDHKIKITAQDEAGNSTEEETNFPIITGISAIINNINYYHELGLIKNEKDKKFLENQLKILEKNLALLEKIKKNDKIKPGAKRELTELFEKLANKHIDLIIQFIETNRRNAFAEKAQELLIESLNFIRPE